MKNVSVYNTSIFSSKEDIIVNTVNVDGIMGTTTSYSIRSKYPNMKYEYNKDMYRKVKSRIFGRDRTLGELHIYKTPINSDNKYVANIYCRKLNSDYTEEDTLKYLKMGLEEIEKYARANSLSIAVPSGIITDNNKDKTDMKNKVLNIVDDVFGSIGYSLYRGELV